MLNFLKLPCEVICYKLLQHVNFYTWFLQATDFNVITVGEDTDDELDEVEKKDTIQLKELIFDKRQQKSKKPGSRDDEKTKVY